MLYVERQRVGRRAEAAALLGAALLTLLALVVVQSLGLEVDAQQLAYTSYRAPRLAFRFKRLVYHESRVFPDAISLGAIEKFQRELAVNTWLSRAAFVPKANTDTPVQPALAHLQRRILDRCVDSQSDVGGVSSRTGPAAAPVFFQNSKERERLCDLAGNAPKDAERDLAAPPAPPATARSSSPGVPRSRYVSSLDKCSKRRRHFA